MGEEQPVESRRSRLRRELTAQIVETGRRQLEQGGASAVSWRAIAREIGMDPASLYTYVDDVNDLFTRILIESFESLADAIKTASESARGEPPLARLLTCATAFRSWAVAHPRQFNLIFTDQIPGYAAPPGGPTVTAATEVERPFIRAIADLVKMQPEQIMDPQNHELRVAATSFRSLLHGYTMLEINNHAPYLDGQPTMMLEAMSQAADAFVRRFSTN